MIEAPVGKSDAELRSARSRLEGRLMRHRLAFNLAVHVVLFSLSLLVAYLLWFDAGIGRRRDLHSYVQFLPYFVGLKLLIFGQMKLFRGGWRYAGIRDVTNILGACWWFAAITFVLYAALYLVPIRWMGIYVYRLWPLGPYFMALPKGVLALDFLATAFIASAVRMGFRIYLEEFRPISPKGLSRVLIVGAGNAAESIVREIIRMPVAKYHVIGFVDDDPAKRHLMIHGYPVLGMTRDIRRICEEQKAREIPIAMPSATQKQLRRVIALCSGTKLAFQCLPGVGDLIDGRVTVNQIRPVDINDLLGRETVRLDTGAVERFLRGRRILITGAGGSIGSEMCRQVCRYAPARLILVEQAETPLFDIGDELRRSFPDIPVAECLCDICDRGRVARVWAEHRPDVVIHAAAHKHVPMLERNPTEALRNNVLGTRNVADASCESGVGEFVMISTDKAVNPSSVMGASKRAAEIYTQSLSAQATCATQFMAVRFGNVLGSAGSVVPTFRRQIAAGGPVTVTHPEMRRYFMTIPEAAQLVLQAAATGSGGQIYLLDMGEPVRIVDLAREMITLSGFRPDEDIDIAFTGVRPGEKLFEELRTAGEDIEPTHHPKILIWKSHPVAWAEVRRMIESIEETQDSADRAAITACLRRFVPEYSPADGGGPHRALPASGLLKPTAREAKAT